MKQPKIVIVDYGMGNLFSIKNAFERLGLTTQISSSWQDVESADGVILPGVGAFGKAMSTLRELKMVDVLRKIADSGKPFMGICLGLQLLMSESSEFGQHEGLNIFPGTVRRLDEGQQRRFKIPHIGWSPIHPAEGLPWEQSVLNGITDGEFLYFVHSYYVKPVDLKICLTKTVYEGVEFCSSLEYKNIFACQFHPEKSAAKGLHIYRNWIGKHWGDLGKQIVAAKEQALS